MKTLVKIVGMLLVVFVLAGGGYVAWVVRHFDASLAKVYDLPLPQIAASSDPEVVERGRHLAHSIGGCSGGDCHGSDLSGGSTLALGPIGRTTGPNITPDATGLATWSYDDFVHLLATAERPDGTRLDPMMPVQALDRLNEVEKRALWAYLRTVEPRPFGER